ncbi:hypothetical protein LOZ58_002559 [Ophidiomyces ophidiicola]|nr:hypothetical protein LOZ66_001320 [Ophidiomyces ophidiicola]KAI1962935.1 hypothetical protein LOZ58_002559 [Ophidiomyces ophidiicola]
MTNQSGSPQSSGSSPFDPYSADSLEDPMEGAVRSLGQGSPSPDDQAEASDAMETSVSIQRTTGTSSSRNGTICCPPESPKQDTSLDQQRKRKRNAPENPPIDQGSNPENNDGCNVAENGSKLPTGIRPLDPNKRLKLSANQSSSLAVPLDRSNLPGEMWQHVFTFLPPISLGRLLKVNTIFKDLLTDAPVKRSTRGLLKFIHPNHIWSSSRKTFHPGMPRPLSSLSELDMWRLVCGTGCQFCKKSSFSSFDGSIWEGGPGPNGTRIIWPFAVRACSECLQKNCEKEMDLLFSSTLPTLLIPAIPFAFFTSSMHFVSSVILRSSQVPSGLSLTKFYLKSHIEAMKDKFEEVKVLGAATAEEWVKGLEGDGKEKIADSARWEQWEATGSLRTFWAAIKGQNGRPNKPDHSETVPHSSNAAGSNTSPNCNFPSRPGRPSFSTNSHGSALPSRPLSPGAQKTTGNSVQPSLHHRSERSIREVNEAKFNRKAEIERRCATLDPPLSASVLSHMDSFQAAIQIPHPFTDRDWEILKPRLLSQRDVAERREQERIQQDKILQAKSEERRQQEAQLKEAKELLDKEWDDIQRPIRERMATYADQIIREGWRDGEGVTKDKCPKFAADVLMYVRDKFYNNITKEDANSRGLGKPIEEDKPGAPPTRKLILENMKWIFDQKIKPLTDPHQKELFLCNGCENNSKYYGFEGVVQHYAAKHTSVLSLGSVVVHWRAEWPEQPPFHPNPNAARAFMFAMPRPTMGQPHHGYQGNSLGPDPYPQISPAPYRRTPYGTPYAYGSGPYRPPSPASSQYYPPQQGNYPYPGPPSGYPPNGPFDPHAQPPPPNPVYGSPYPGQGYPPPYAGPEARPPMPSAPYPAPFGPPHAPSYGPAFSGNSHTSRPGPAPSNKSNPNSQAFGFYQAQLDELAKHARAIWNGTSGIKDLPHNVRAHVLLHHVVIRFLERFGHEPPLALFSDALNTHPQMKPIRNLSGLVCKTCTIPGTTHGRRGRGHDRKPFTLPAVISHFLSVHLSRDDPPPDWKTKMIGLPDDSVISSLAQTPGVDPTKFQLIVAAFPWVFSPTTLDMADNDNSSMGEGLNSQKDPPPRGHSASERGKRPRHHSAGIKSENVISDSHRGHLEVAVDDFPKFIESPLNDGSKHLESPKEDEYDPHRPAFIEHGRDPGSRLENHRMRPKSLNSAPIQDIDPIQASLLAEKSAPDSRVDIHKLSHRQGPSLESSNRQYSERPSKADLTGAEAISGFPDDPHHGIQQSEVQSRNVSEDGEVAEPLPPRQARPKPNSPFEELSAAERFLSSFVPGQDLDDYKSKAGEAHRSHDPSGAQWLDPEDMDPRRWRTDVGGTAEGSVTGDAPRDGRRSWGARTNSPTTARGYREFEQRVDVENSMANRHANAVSPEPRHGRRALAYSDTRHQAENVSRRPQSRFDRYEAQRQGSLRPRSRSPKAHDALTLEQTYYRDRSPRVRTRRPTYSDYPPPESYYDRVPLEHTGPYTRVPSHSQYQYMDDPRYTDRPFDGAVEYIPVRVSGREPQNPTAYYIERPVHRDMAKEYVDYEMEYRRQPVYEEQPQYYPAETIPHHGEGAPGPMTRRARYR